MDIDFPDKLQFLFEPHPYKIAYGGRDGTKSWGFARALLILGAQRKLRILCARETQKSITDSVHTLLSDQISQMGMEEVYKIQQFTISAANGTKFIFAGLKQNIGNIKSLEGCDIIWVEEAAGVSKNSWEVVLPTFRKACSEIWVSFNPELSTDDTYKRWVLNPPPGSVVVKIGYQDNLWLSEISKTRIDHMRATEPETFLHVYGGACRSQVEGAIYGAELKVATAEGRICSVPYDRTRPVDTAWDLGYGDKTVVWFIQAYGGFYNFIDYLDGEGQTISDYCVELQRKPYLYGTDWLPHDCVDTIIHQRLAGDKSMSIEQLMRQAGRKVRVVPKMLVTAGINSARTIFPQCRFDETRCADGVQALRHYQWGEQTDKEKQLGIKKEAPLHNWASHAADAFRGAAISVRQPKDLPPPPANIQTPRRSGALGFAR